MTKPALLLSLLVALPAMAQSHSAALSIGRVQSLGQTFDAAVGGSGQVNYGQFNSETFTALGLQLAWSPCQLGPLALELTLAAQAPSTKNLTESYWGELNGVPTGFQNGTQGAQLRYGYEAVGARLAGHLPIDWSVGLEARGESLRLVENAVGTLSCTQIRPWLAARVGYTFPSVVVKPFVALNWSLALAKQSNDGGFDNSLAKSMAPTSEWALEGGIRF
jgi:hypothetical protein